MFAPISPTAGVQPFNDWFVPDTTQRHPVGLTVTAIDPYWGVGKFMYVKSTDAILKGSICIWDELYQSVLIPTTVLQGFPWGVAMAAMSTGKYGWIQLEGKAVYQCSATVAADGIVAIAAAGVLAGTATGKQMTGIRHRLAATGTKTFTANTTNGSKAIDIPGGYDGAFVGLVITGTGIGAATCIIASLDPNGHTVYADKVSTATGTITMTGTFTGFSIGMINNPTTMVAVA